MTTRPASLKRDEKLFRLIGAELFGPSWQTPLADRLGVAYRTVQRWASGRNPPPLSVWNDLAELCEKRRGEIEIARLQIIHSVDPVQP